MARRTIADDKKIVRPAAEPDIETAENKPARARKAAVEEEVDAYGRVGGAYGSE